MLMTTVCGFIQMYFPCGMYKPTQRLMRPPGFYRHMMLVGCTRYMKYLCVKYGDPHFWTSSSL